MTLTYCGRTIGVMRTMEGGKEDLGDYAQLHAIAAKTNWKTRFVCEISQDLSVGA